MNRWLLPSVIAIVISFFAFHPLFAGSLSVEYLEGRLESRSGSVWTDRFIGDSIPESAGLRLSKGGYAELGYEGSTVSLVQDGIYSAAELVENAGREMSFRDILGAKLEFLIKGRPRENTVLATRAEKPGESEQLWFYSDTDAASENLMFVDEGDYLQDGLDMMDLGDLKAAAGFFYEGSLYDFGEVRRECAFRLGVVSQMAGELRYSREILTSEPNKAEPDDSHYGEYVLTVSALYIESREYPEAEVLLKDFLAGGAGGEEADAAAYLLGLIS
jgi:hypothetical protein